MWNALEVNWSFPKKKFTNQFCWEFPQIMITFLKYINVDSETKTCITQKYIVLLRRTENVYCSELFPGKSNKQSKYKSRLYLPLRGGWGFPHNETFCCLSTLRLFLVSSPIFFNYLSWSLYTKFMKQIPNSWSKYHHCTTLNTIHSPHWEKQFALFTLPVEYKRVAYA